MCWCPEDGLRVELDFDECREERTDLGDLGPFQFFMFVVLLGHPALRSEGSSGAG